MHKHNHCDHELKWCRDCQTPFCVKCNKEWGEPCRQIHYPLFGTYSVSPQPAYPWRPWIWGASNTADPLPAGKTTSVISAGADAAGPPATACTHGRN